MVSLQLQRKLPTHGHKVMKDFVNKFRKKQHARSFLIPVKSQLSPADYEAYLRVVEHPIDMGEISKKLDSGGYAKPVSRRNYYDVIKKIEGMGCDCYGLTFHAG